MSKGTEKICIFDTMEGCHDKRFVAFNDMPLCSSKFTQGAVPDLGAGPGRERAITQAPPEDMPEYDVPVSH
jgi:hypothetical protein